MLFLSRSLGGLVRPRSPPSGQTSDGTTQSVPRNRFLWKVTQSDEERSVTNVGLATEPSMGSALNEVSTPTRRPPTPHKAYRRPNDASSLETPLPPAHPPPPPHLPLSPPEAPTLPTADPHTCSEIPHLLRAEEALLCSTGVVECLLRLAD